MERTQVDRSHHDFLGIDDGADVLLAHGSGILSRALFGRCCGGWFPAGSHRVLDSLVSLPGPGKGSGIFLRCQSALLCDRFTAGRFTARNLMVRTEGLALAVHYRGDYGDPVGRDHYLVSHRLAGSSGLAPRGRAILDYHRTAARKRRQKALWFPQHLASSPPP